MEDADFDRVLSLGGEGGREAHREASRGREPAAAVRSIRDRTEWVEHHNVLCFDVSERNADRAPVPVRKEHAKQNARCRRLIGASGCLFEL